MAFVGGEGGGGVVGSPSRVHPCAPVHTAYLASSKEVLGDEGVITNYMFITWVGRPLQHTVYPQRVKGDRCITVPHALEEYDLP